MANAKIPINHNVMKISCACSTEAQKGMISATLHAWTRSITAQHESTTRERSATAKGWDAHHKASRSEASGV
jgi:hypothetical protein